jgi:hypothetical protein
MALVYAVRPKALALVALAALSLVSPMIERIATGQVEPMSGYGIGETLASLVLLFWWYHLDKAEHNYRAGKLMNAGVLVLAVIALPVYLVRSRGWRRGAIAIGVAAAFLGATLALGELGERLGAALSRASAAAPAAAAR